jgi:hypothetical protein
MRQQSGSGHQIDDECTLGDNTVVPRLWIRLVLAVVVAVNRRASSSIKRSMREAREACEAREVQEARETREVRETRETREAWEAQEVVQVAGQEEAAEAEAKKKKKEKEKVRTHWVGADSVITYQGGALDRTPPPRCHSHLCQVRRPNLRFRRHLRECDKGSHLL